MSLARIENRQRRYHLINYTRSDFRITASYQRTLTRRLKSPLKRPIFVPESGQRERAKQKERRCSFFTIPRHSASIPRNTTRHAAPVPRERWKKKDSTFRLYASLKSRRFHVHCPRSGASRLRSLRKEKKSESRYQAFLFDAVIFPSRYSSLSPSFPSIFTFFFLVSLYV